MAANFVEKMANSSLSSLWHSKMKWDIATSMCALIAYMMPIYRVKFGPVSPEPAQKTGTFSQISPDILDRFSQSFHGMKAIYFPICQRTLPWQPNNVAVMKVK